MSNKIIEPKIKTPQIEVDKKLLNDIKEQADKEKQVIVNCCFIVPFLCSSIRIRQDTYLKTKGKYISTLISGYNIAMFPNWSFVRSGLPVRFCLIFSGLDKNIKSFTVFEDIPENGFYSLPVERNETDVYSVELYV